MSWGIGCAQEGVPGAYARVSLYLDWIQANTGVHADGEIERYEGCKDDHTNTSGRIRGSGGSVGTSPAPTDAPKPNPCKSNPCPARAQCLRTEDSYRCSCPNGWAGDDCTTPNLCELVEPCENGAVCKNSEDYKSYDCTCTSAWSGQHCTKKVTTAAPTTTTAAPTTTTAAPTTTTAAPTTTEAVQVSACTSVRVRVKKRVRGRWRWVWEDACCETLSYAKQLADNTCRAKLETDTGVSYIKYRELYRQGKRWRARWVYKTCTEITATDQSTIHKMDKKNVEKACELSVAKTTVATTTSRGVNSHYKKDHRGQMTFRGAK